MSGVVTLADVVEAQARIAAHVRCTPVVEIEPAALGTPMPVTLKLEQLQHTGSFKARGGFNRILCAREAGALPPAGVIAASGGNHGLAVAYAARSLGVPAHIFVPEAASPVKVAGIHALGAEVTVTGAFYADAYDACLEVATATGALFVHAYDQPEVVAGQGTVGLELAAQLADRLDTVLVAVGGGGLAGGVVAALGDRVKVVAVEPRSIPTWHEARAAGRPVDVSVSGIAADSLGAKQLGATGFASLAEHKVESVLVSDHDIVEARRHMWDRLRIVAEPGGATAAAALLSRAYRPAAAERVAVVVCGGNTDPSDLNPPPLV